MNCACNRYKTCTECRNAYKETVKRERRISEVIAELDHRSGLYGGEYGIACKTAIDLFNNGVKQIEIK